MPDEKAIKLGKQIIQQADLKISVEYKGEIFIMQYPNPLQRALIETNISNRLGGVPREAHTALHVAAVTATCYVDLLIIPAESPDWFISAWTCFDEELIATLYSGYLDFRDSFQTKIREGRFQGPSKGSSS